MTQFIYTALRELTGVTPANSLATAELDLTNEYTKSRSVVRDVVVAKGGAREIMYHRTDKTHNITFAPVNGFKRKQLEELLASTESGEEFQIYIYGNESLPISVYRTDDGSQMNPFMPVGGVDTDYWQASITVTEV